jgi:manganese/iron transport system ATP-binding protein
VSVFQAVLSGRVGKVGILKRYRKIDRTIAHDCIDRVGLADLSQRPIRELSGGQQQRVLVARALALQPILLVLDEPFTGLDVGTQNVLTQLFRATRANGDAVLLTTHDLSAAMALCDRLYLLNRTVVAHGRPDELRRSDAWLATFGIPLDVVSPGND